MKQKVTANFLELSIDAIDKAILLLAEEYNDLMLENDALREENEVLKTETKKSHEEMTI